MKRTWLIAFAAAFLFVSRAEAFVAERIVAVVGERPILLSELRHRAIPELVNGAHEGTILRAVLTRMIEDRLIEQAAQRARLAVAVQDIDRAIETKAKELHVSTADLMAEAVREGFSEQDYRDEIRRQILEGKLLQLRIAGRVHVTEADARTAYAEWSHDRSAKRFIDLRVVAGVDAPARVIVRGLEATCLAGQDICVASATRALTCANHSVPTASLPPNIQARLPGCALVELPNETDLLQGEMSITPAFESVRAQMMVLATEGAFLRERAAFMAELRRSTYVEMRLNE